MSSYSSTPPISNSRKSTMLSSLQTCLDVDLPVLDISLFLQGLDSLDGHRAIDTLRYACKEWGFFSVVNHGIPTDLIENVQYAICQLCAMPTDAKERAATSNPNESYACRPGLESLCIMNSPDFDSVQEVSLKIWPEEGNPKFCETIRTYLFCLSDLARKISKIILVSLGLDANGFYHSDFENCAAYLRINHYSYKGESMEEETLPSHTDLGCFTILYQGNEGGLQIRSKAGTWLNVNPASHSFVVNVADSLKAWSNRRYRSAEHGMVYKGWMDRISLAYIVHFPDDKQIWAPSELVDDDHPRRYTPFTIRQFKHDFYNEFYSNMHSKQEKATFIDHYAGV